MTLCVRAHSSDPAERSLVGPHWISGVDGHEILVQVPKPGYHPPAPSGGSPWHLMPEMVQLPNGQIAQVHVPLSAPGQQLQAEWLKLPDGDYALIHHRIPTRGSTRTIIRSLILSGPVASRFYQKKSIAPGIGKDSGSPLRVRQPRCCPTSGRL